MMKISLFGQPLQALVLGERGFSDGGGRNTIRVDFINLPT
jgi:hypothetical protein